MPTFDKSLDFALDVLRAHPTWCLFPIKRYQKHPPMFLDNLNLASNDPKQLAAWHSKWPGCNWGIACKKSGLIVVDVDRKRGKSGEDTFCDLELKHGDTNTDAFPTTFKVQSPTGGWHLYYNATKAVPHRHKLGKQGFGPDVDSPNYVLAPGCWLFDKDKKTGEKITGGYDPLTDHEVVDAPEWFAQYLKDSEKAEGGSIPETDLDQPGNIAWCIHYLEHDAPPCIEGQNGEKTLLDVAGVLKDHGVSQYKAVELLSEHYNVFGKCDPLWSVGDGPIQDRLDVKVENAYRYLSENAPGAKTPQAQFAGEPEITDAEAIEMQQSTARNEARRKKTVEDKALKVGLPPDDGDDDPPPTGTDGAAKGSTADTDADKARAEAKAEAEAEARARNKAASDRVKNRPPNEESRAWTVAEVLDEWIYIKNLKRFVWRRDPEFRNYVWDVEAFDLAYCNLRGGVLRFSKKVLEGLNGTPMIRKFDNMAYLPGEDEFCGDVYNLYRPSDVTPKEGDTSFWNVHLEYLFPNKIERDLVLNWIAWMLQNIAEKPTHALLLTGYQQGTGKSFVGEVVKRILGAHNVAPVGEDELDSTFNEWALKSKMLLVEELQALDRGSVKKKLHPLITQQAIIINDKNVKRYKVDNCFAIMAMSNEDAAISINQNDRRYLVVRTHSLPQDDEYYRALYAKLKDRDAMGAVYHELLTRELGTYSGKSRAPSTAAKVEMIEAGLTDLEHWCVTHADAYPLNAKVISVDDIEGLLPPRIAKLPKFTQNIASILRHRFFGHPLGQCRMPNGRDRRSLWGINKYSGVGIREAFHGKVYVDDKAKADKITGSAAAHDFADDEVSATE